MGLVQKFGELLSRPKTAIPSSPQHRAGYMRDNRNTLFQGWRPPLNRSYVDVANGWQMAAARATDMIQNSGYLAGMVDQYVSDTVGKGLQLRLKPNVQFFGGEDKAMQWASYTEASFRRWANQPMECDAEQRSTFGKMQAQQARAYLTFGETFTSMPLRRQGRGSYLTKFKVIPAYLAQSKSDGMATKHGVKIDEYGAPQGYYFWQKREDTFMQQEDVFIPRYDSVFRPNVIHVFDGAVGQVRGISPIAPALQVLRQFDRLQDATLTAATLQTIFAATIKSELPSREILEALKTPSDPAKGSTGGSLIDEWLQGSVAWNKDVDINLGNHGRVTHLMPNEELVFNKNEHPNQFYDKFVGALLREVARCIGLTVESATGDFSAATYASLNIGTTINYALTLQRRQNVIAPMNDQVFDCWLEEDIDAGRTKFPGGLDGFYKNRTIAFETSWRGPGKYQADDLKSAKYMETVDGVGVASHTELAEERGRDIEDVYLERSREQKLREKLGLRDPVKQRVPDVAEQLLMNEPDPKASAQ